MKLTEQKLREIIREELTSLNESSIVNEIYFAEPIIDTLWDIDGKSAKIAKKGFKKLTKDLVKLLDEFTDLFAKATSSGKTLTSRHKFFGKTKDDLISAKYAVLRAILPFSDAFPTNQRHNNDDLYDDWKEITNNFMNSAGTWSEKDKRDASKKYNKYLLDGLKQTTTWSIEYIEDYAKKKANK